MKIEYLHGDALEGPETVIIQGCNAQGAMGSGFAKAIRDRHPEVYDGYRAIYERQGNRLRLGQVITVDVGSRIFANAITQEFYGRDPDVVYVSYDAMAAAYEEMDRIAISARVGEEPPRFAMPLIGAGLANGDWSIIAAIIEAKAKNFVPVVYRFP
jgi:O-acetyl-ADP-ribose deacetylase (regulator of RNase III)